MYIHRMSKSYWRDSTRLHNGYDYPVVFDFDQHTFEFPDIGTVTYRLLPKCLDEFGRVFIELSFPGEETVTRGTIRRLHEHIDHDLWEEREDRIGPYFSKRPSIFVRRLSNYEWEDDDVLLCRTDDRRILIDDEDLEKDTLVVEEIGEVTYRLLPKGKSTSDVFVELSWYEEEPVLWDSIYRLYDRMDHDIF